ncbi:MAG: hypothetical protein AAGF50_08495 [Pseudomonadota bacterium]
MPVTDDFRAKYTAALKAVYDIEAERRRLLAPTEAAHDAALDRLTELEDDLPDEVCKCGNCGALIIPGDPRWYDDGLDDVCVDCAPTFADLQRDHQDFTWRGDEMSREKADEIVRKHLECGGSLTDSMAL